MAKCPASCCKLAVLERDGRVCGASRGILACRLILMSRHVYHVNQRPSPPLLAFAQGVAIKIWGECYVITVPTPPGNEFTLDAAVPSSEKVEALLFFCREPDWLEIRDAQTGTVGPNGWPPREEAQRSW